MKMKRPFPPSIPLTMFMIALAFAFAFAACAKSPLLGGPGAFKMAADSQGSKASVDGLWIINTATVRMKEDHIVEGGGSGEQFVPVLCALVKKNDDYLLIDTGLNHQFAFNPETYLGFVNYQIARILMNMPTMEPGRDVVAQLVRIGVNPEKVSKIILTHAHVDHTGEIPAFTNAKILVSAKERQFLQRAFGQTRGVMQKDFPQDRIEVMSFKDSKSFLTFESNFDVFGDGSVVVVPSYGHTPGSVSVFVQMKQTSFLFAGDAAYSMKNIAKPSPTGYCEDRDEAWRTMLRLHDLHRARPDIQMILSHDSKYLELGRKGPADMSGGVNP